jgi:hypothetical protein
MASRILVSPVGWGFETAPVWIANLTHARATSSLGRCCWVSSAARTWHPPEVPQQSSPVAASSTKVERLSRKGTRHSRNVTPSVGRRTKPARARLSGQLITMAQPESLWIRSDRPYPRPLGRTQAGSTRQFDWDPPEETSRWRCSASTNSAEEVGNNRRRRPQCNPRRLTSAPSWKTSSARSGTRSGSGGSRIAPTARSG